jgi:hypothetical protein
MSEGRDTSLGAHLRVGITAGVLLAMCQVIIETLVIAVHSRGYLLAPESFSPSQRLDFAVKLLSAVPTIAAWMESGVLGRFLPVGFVAHLALAAGLLLPNLVVAIVLGAAIGCVRRLAGRPARIGGALWMVVAAAAIVQIASLVAALHLPTRWTTAELVRNVGRLFWWDGAGLSWLALVLAAAVAIVLVRLRPVYGVAVVLIALAVAVIGLTGSSIGAAALQRDTAAPSPAGARAHPPIDNVVLISIDSLRADHLGSYGYPRATSPTLDALAAQGVRFSHAVSATSWTLPSHMSMLTGRYPLAHGVLEDTDRLPDGIPTLAESLQGAGISTGGIVSMQFVGSSYGFGRGFDYYDDHTIPAKNEVDALRDEPAPKVEELALRFLGDHQQRRFFLFLHFWDVHYDYVPPPPYDTMFDPTYRGSVTGENFLDNPAVYKGMPAADLAHLLALYDGEIRWVDDHIAHIVAALDALGLADRTAIIVTADHGDEFFEHGFKGHRRTLYDEVVHVPLIMRIPGQASAVVDTPVSLVDLMPTILELTGVPAPAGLDGTSVMAAVGRDGDGQPLYSELCGRRRSLCQVAQRWQAQTLIHRFEPLRLELYADAGQKDDLVRKGQRPAPVLMSRLGDHLNAVWAAHGRDGASRPHVELDQATRDRLRALGYGD